MTKDSIVYVSGSNEKTVNLIYKYIEQVKSFPYKNGSVFRGEAFGWEMPVKEYVILKSFLDADDSDFEVRTKDGILLNSIEIKYILEVGDGFYGKDGIIY